jgi:glycosyltransferase involved in cell wall biosynthesis
MTNAPTNRFTPLLHTCFSRSWGGLEMQALEVAAHLMGRGHPLWLACCTGSSLAREAAARGIPLVPLPVTGYLHPTLVWRLSRFLRRNQIGIIHCQHSRDLAIVVPAADCARSSPAIILSKRMGSYVHKLDPLHRYTYSRVRRVLAISGVIHQNVRETTPVKPQAIITLHDAIDTTAFSPGKGNRRRIRAEFGYARGTVVVGFVGRFSPGKGHEELLDAAASLGRSRPYVRFLVAGEASEGEEAYADHIRQRSASLGLGGIVTFAGFRRDVADMMASFDILAFPSHAESFGVVLIEAMAMELPVVSTNCDGVLDIVVNGVTGLFVAPRDAAALAAVLGTLVDSPALRRRLGRAGRQRVLKLFDRDRQMVRLEQIYREVLVP